MVDALNEFSLQWTLLFQAWGDGFLSILAAVSWLGREEFYLLVMPVILWSFDYTLGLRLGSMLVLSNAVNAIGKLALHTPRPFWNAEAVHPFGAAENNFSAPSGHAQVPVTVYGLLAVQLRRRWFTILAVLLILVLGLGRVPLGMHYLQDVLVGWVFGFVVLWAFLTFEKPILDWALGRPAIQQYLLALAAGLLVALLGWLALTSTQAWAMPEEWGTLASRFLEEGETFNPRNLDAVLTSSGAMTGLWWGYLWLNERGGFSAQGAWWQRVVRFLIGLAGVLALWAGLGSVFPDGMDLAGFSLRFLRYLLVGLWISGFAPWLFRRLKLAA
jgi:membrane-associated phospholipid phosphatase